MEARISRSQIAKIWAIAGGLGLDSELLHLLAPRGSISGMTMHEASELIEYLVALEAKGRAADQGSRDTRGADQPAADGRAKPLSAGPDSAVAQGGMAATRDQLNFIHFMFGRLGWVQQPVRMQGFLRKYAHVASVEEIRDRKRASAVIEALKAILRRQGKRKV